MRSYLAVFLVAINVFFIVPSVADDENPFGSSERVASSLTGEIFFLTEGTSGLPDFSGMEPVGSIYAKVLDIPTRSFTSGFPGVTDRFEWFAIRYTGTFNVDEAGDYGFRLVSDDGSRLFVDGQRIIDNDGIHPPRSASGNVRLSRGKHTIEIDYFQGPRQEIALQLFWTPPGGTESISEPEYTPESSSSPGTDGSLQPSSNFAALHRWYSSSSGDHFYTTDPTGELAPGSGYVYEGIVGYIATTEIDGTVALHRWYSSSSGDHFYTTDPTGELAPGSGYSYEGITGYVAKTKQSGTVALYRWFSTSSGDHFYTTDAFGELAPSSGYDYEGIAGYIWSKAPDGQKQNTNAPDFLDECETYNYDICGTWILSGDKYEATWQNDATAILKIEKWDNSQVILTRNDITGSSQGLSARYTGHISGNEIADGSVTWTWKGQTWTGTWKASW